jgi:hypothetical protein
MASYDDPAQWIDNILFLLSNHRRRVVIRYLDDAETASLRTIAEVISEHECCASDPSTVYVNLYQNHAPKLQRHDVVAYDESAKCVSQGTQFALCADIVACADDLAQSLRE